MNNDERRKARNARKRERRLSPYPRPQASSFARCASEDKPLDCEASAKQSALAWLWFLVLGSLLALFAAAAIGFSAWLQRGLGGPDAPAGSFEGR